MHTFVMNTGKRVFLQNKTMENIFISISQVWLFRKRPTDFHWIFEITFYQLDLILIKS